MYGRVQQDISVENICPGNSWHFRGACVAESSLSVVSDRCNLRRSCSIEASNHNFGDPCFGIEKYLEVDYTCIPANAVPNKVTKRSTACEKGSSPLSLSCPSGYLIQVTGAMYGRVQQDISVENICPGNSWHFRGACVAESSLSVVSDRCNLRRSCSIEASNHNFGDPCFGIEKYLEVDYTCISGFDAIDAIDSFDAFAIAIANLKI